TVYNTRVGISGGGVVTGNRVFNCAVYGIDADPAGKVIGNVVYSNGIGINAGNSPLIQNNLIYANTTAGIRISAAYDLQVLGNTIYQPTGDGIRFEGVYSGRIFRLTSNIIQVGSGYAIWLDNEQISGLASDYNTIFTTGAGKFVL